VARRELLPLESAPDWVLAAYRGDCLRCKRPMATQRAIIGSDTIRATFVRHIGRGICTGCWKREDRAARSDNQPPNNLAALRGTAGRRLTWRQVLSLRVQLGCTGCEGRRHDAGCPMYEPKRRRKTA
jgi:hypothetical protein